MTRLLEFEIPDRLIAQHPLEHRDHARLMCLTRGRPRVVHRRFDELPGLLPQQALLVFNDTRVLPWRLLGTLPTGTATEALLLGEREPGLWEAMLRRARRVRPGMTLVFCGGALQARAERQVDEGHWLLRFETPQALPDVLERHGLAPLPPYIRRNAQSAPAFAVRDRDAYQTVYARAAGAIAAPTAGLHFTPGVLAALDTRGIERATLTLHVGLGTFKPITSEDPEAHRMHRERVLIPPQTIERVRAARAAGRPVIAVGTTTVRALESWAACGEPDALDDWTALYIRGRYPFRVTDGIITNFHQPRSTLLLMIAAFHGETLLMQAYQAAADAGYRFFSFGDCMAILPADDPPT